MQRQARLGGSRSLDRLFWRSVSDSFRGSCKIPQTAVCGYFKFSLQTRELTTLLIPQTAVCGYFKSSLYEGKANLMENVVLGRTLSCRSLGLEQLQTAVWSVFAEALKLDLAIVIDRAIPSSLSSTSCNPLFSPNRSERSIV